MVRERPPLPPPPARLEPPGAPSVVEAARELVHRLLRPPPPRSLPPSPPPPLSPLLPPPPLAADDDMSRPPHGPWWVAGQASDSPLLRSNSSVYRPPPPAFRSVLSVNSAGESLEQTASLHSKFSAPSDSKYSHLDGDASFASLGVPPFVPDAPSRMTSVPHSEEASPVPRAAHTRREPLGSPRSGPSGLRRLPLLSRRSRRRPPSPRTPRTPAEAPVLTLPAAMGSGSLNLEFTSHDSPSPSPATPGSPPVHSPPVLPPPQAHPPSSYHPPSSRASLARNASAASNSSNQSAWSSSTSSDGPPVRRSHRPLPARIHNLEEDPNIRLHRSTSFGTASGVELRRSGSIRRRSRLSQPPPSTSPALQASEDDTRSATPQRTSTLRRIVSWASSVSSRRHPIPFPTLDDTSTQASVAQTPIASTSADVPPAPAPTVLQTAARTIRTSLTRTASVVSSTVGRIFGRSPVPDAPRPDSQTGGAPAHSGRDSPKGSDHGPSSGSGQDRSVLGLLTRMGSFSRPHTVPGAPTGPKLAPERLWYLPRKKEQTIKLGLACAGATGTAHALPCSRSPGAGPGPSQLPLSSPGAGLNLQKRLSRRLLHRLPSEMEHTGHATFGFSSGYVDRPTSPPAARPLPLRPLSPPIPPRRPGPDGSAAGSPPAALGACTVGVCAHWRAWAEARIDARRGGSALHEDLGDGDVLVQRVHALGAEHPDPASCAACAPGPAPASPPAPPDVARPSTVPTARARALVAAHRPPDPPREAVSI